MVTVSLIVSAGPDADAGIARKVRTATAGKTDGSPTGASGNPARLLGGRGETDANPSTTPTAAYSETSTGSRNPIGRRIALAVPTIVRGGRDEMAIGAGGSEDHSLRGRDDANAGATTSSDDA